MSIGHLARRQLILGLVVLAALLSGSAVFLTMTAPKAKADNDIRGCPVSPASTLAVCIATNAAGAGGTLVNESGNGVDTGIMGTDWTLAELSAATADGVGLTAGSATSGILPSAPNANLPVDQTEFPPALPLNPSLAGNSIANYPFRSSR
jgi:hypothetical protein